MCTDQHATAFECQDISDSYAVTIKQLAEWNAWIGSGDCDSGLYANLAYYDKRAVCIGVNASATTSTTSVSTTSSSVTAPGPTQSGIVAGCTAYYTVPSGGSCAAIETAYTITFAQFYAWNPAST